MAVTWNGKHVPGNRPPTAEELRAFDKAEELASMASINPAFDRTGETERRTSPVQGEQRPMVPVIPGQRVDPAGGYRRSYEWEMGQRALEAIEADRVRRGVGPEPVRPKKGWEGIKQGAETVVEAITSPAQVVGGAVKDWAGNVVDRAQNVADIAKNVGEGIVDVVTWPATTAYETVKGPLDGDDGDPEKKIEGNRGLYPTQGEWGGEPGGVYLSARYPREFGTWGKAVAGEGWKHVADRGGWDSHTHPAHTSIEKRYKQPRAVQAYRSY